MAALRRKRRSPRESPSDVVDFGPTRDLVGVYLLCGVFVLYDVLCFAVRLCVSVCVCVSVCRCVCVCLCVCAGAFSSCHCLPPMRPLHTGLFAAPAVCG